MRVASRETFKYMQRFMHDMSIQFLGRDMMGYRHSISNSAVECSELVVLSGSDVKHVNVGANLERSCEKARHREA